LLAIGAFAFAGARAHELDQRLAELHVARAWRGSRFDRRRSSLLPPHVTGTAMRLRNLPSSTHCSQGSHQVTTTGSTGATASQSSSVIGEPKTCAPATAFPAQRSSMRIALLTGHPVRLSYEVLARGACSPNLAGHAPAFNRLVRRHAGWDGMRRNSHTVSRVADRLFPH